VWRIFRRRQDAVLARLEALEGRAGRQDRRQQDAEERVNEVFRTIGGTCERAGVPVTPRIRLVSDQRDSA
jgi:hypothetical protein